MKDGWEKASRAVGDTVTGVKIVSSKVKTKNNSPRGFWEYTHYFVRCADGSKEFWRLRDAKTYVRKELCNAVR